MSANAQKSVIKEVELRRHTLRNENGGISEDGRRLVEAAVKTLQPPYASWYASSKQRSIETAEAMGFPNPTVDERLGTLAMTSETEAKAKRLAETKGLSSLEAYFAIPECRTILKQAGQRVLSAVAEMADKLAPGDRALAVSHGGSIEPAALLAMGEAFSLEALGGELQACEGVVFLFEGSTLVGLKVLRLIQPGDGDAA